MSDMPSEIARNEYIERHLLLCGTCKYKHKGRCTNMGSDCVGGIVDDDCSCNEYVPKKGLRIF